MGGEGCGHCALGNATLATSSEQKGQGRRRGEVEGGRWRELWAFKCGEEGGGSEVVGMQVEGSSWRE